MAVIECPRDDCDVAVTIRPAGRNRFERNVLEPDCILGHGPYCDDCPELMSAERSWHSEYRAQLRERRQEVARSRILGRRDD